MSSITTQITQSVCTEAHRVAIAEAMATAANLQDRTSSLDKSSPILENQLSLATVTKACALHSLESQRIVETFEVHDDDIR